MLTFEENGHVYRWAGQPVPSVTQILNEWVMVPGRGIYVNTRSGTAVDVQIFEDAGDFGTAVHRAAAYILSGQGIQWNMLDAAIVPPLRELGKWMYYFQIKPFYIEQPMYSEKHRVAGTPDIIGELRGFKNLGIVDIKTGLNNPSVGPQTAGYELIFREEKKYRKPITRYELILPRDGSPYRFTAVNGINDGAYFLSKLFQWNFKGGL